MDVGCSRPKAILYGMSEIVGDKKWQLKVAYTTGAYASLLKKNIYDLRSHNLYWGFPIFLFFGRMHLFHQHKTKQNGKGKVEPFKRSGNIEMSIGFSCDGEIFIAAVSVYGHHFVFTGACSHQCKTAWHNFGRGYCAYLMQLQCGLFYFWSRKICKPCPKYNDTLNNCTEHQIKTGLRQCEPSLYVPSNNSIGCINGLKGL